MSSNCLSAFVFASGEFLLINAFRVAGVSVLITADVAGVAIAPSAAADASS